MNEIKKLKQKLKGKFFSAEFIKKNGELRKIHARLGVIKHLKGGTKKYDAESRNLLTVYDLQTRQYRTINVGTLRSIKCGKLRL